MKLNMTLKMRPIETILGLKLTANNIVMKDTFWRFSPES